MQEDPSRTVSKDVQNLNASYWRHPNDARISLFRNIGLSGAAVCLAVLLAATQITSKGAAAQVSIYAAVVGMPAWFFYAGIHDYYLLLGQATYVHFSEKGTQKFFERTLLFAGACTFLSLASLAQFLVPYGALLFCATALVFFYFASRFHIRLATWWARQPGHSEKSDV